MRAALALMPIAMLAACSGAGEDASDNLAAEAPANVVATPTGEATPTRIVGGGWSDIFAKGQESVDVFTATGFRAGKYKRDGETYRASGIRTTMSHTEAPKPNISTIVVTGTRDRVTQVSFVLELTDPENAQAAKERFVKALDWALRKIGVPGADAIRQPVLDEKPAAGSVQGAEWQVERAPMDGTDTRKLTVTFTPAADNAAEASPRNG